MTLGQVMRPGRGAATKVREDIGESHARNQEISLRYLWLDGAGTYLRSPKYDISSMIHSLDRKETNCAFNAARGSI